MEDGSRLGFHLPFVRLSQSDVRDYCEDLTNPEGRTTDRLTRLPNPFADKSADCLMRTYQMGLRDMRSLSKYLTRDGISEVVLDLIINTQSSDMTWVGVAQAREYGLVNSN